ncbi:MAG TPA: hypothetical protein VNQ56_00650 [Pseudolabrys sp.]|nr:hypothetical protein [Pseudolabrys sp.]
MSKKLAELKALLADLKEERESVDAAIEQMVGELAAVAPEERSGGGWGPDGARTRAFLELTNRQSDLEAEIDTVSREVAARQPDGNTLH